MKDKIFIFIIGLLLGAIISTASIYIYTLANNNSNSNERRNEMQMNGGTPPEMPSGGFGEKEAPPELSNNNQTGA